MIVVSDTSPLTALLTVGQAELLPRLFGEVVIPEAEAIALAQELKADLLLMDERKGRRLARERGVQVMGLVGVILFAKRRGLVDSARALLKRLESEAGVYFGERLKADALNSVDE